VSNVVVFVLVHVEIFGARWFLIRETEKSENTRFGAMGQTEVPREGDLLAWGHLPVAYQPELVLVVDSKEGVQYGIRSATPTNVASITPLFPRVNVERELGMEENKR
jgi:hypothetical protein